MQRYAANLNVPTCWSYAPGEKFIAENLLW